MRWVTFATNEDQARTGIIVDDVIFAAQPGVRLVDLLGGGSDQLASTGDELRRRGQNTFRLADVRLLPPVPQPPSIRDFVSFEEHHRSGIASVGQQWDDAYYDMPAFYFTNPNSVHGDKEVVHIPNYTKAQDFELEIGCIIGREGRDLDPVEAEDYIAGYCIFNDWSARDIQADEMKRIPVGPAKGKDFAMSAGPCLVTPDELEDVRKGHGFDLAMRATVNGREYSSGNWSSVYWSFGEMLAHASRGARLVPGDLLASGTVGTGCILEQSATHGVDKYPWLKPGDVVTLEIERLGSLTNTIALAPAAKPIRGKVAGSRTSSFADKFNAMKKTA
jgi:2-keto-4-pentenoate hydratase/2-oxohepta-3-ene-1,7-dioic acid hydratase in catechol pathway